MAIADEETASQLHGRMMEEGAKLILETLDLIVSGKAHAQEQSNFIRDESVLKKAPKINKEDCRIDWGKKGNQVVDFVRGLSRYPAAFSEFESDKGDSVYLKIYKSVFEKALHSFRNGELFSDGSTYIKVSVPDGFVILSELQQAGKKRIDSRSYLRGNRFDGKWRSKQ